jgi:hypothetical protein
MSKYNLRSKKKRENDKVKEHSSNVLDEFIMEDSIMELTHHPYITIIGQRHSGKGVLINELVYHLDKKFKYDNIFCFSMTAKMTGAFDFMSQKCIYDNLDNLKKIIDIRKESGSKSPLLLIFDDIASMTSIGSNGKRKNIRYNETLEFLSTTARHYNISVVLSIQNRVLCSKTCRNNSSYSFIFTPKSHDDMKTIKNEYLGLSRSKDETDKIFDSVFREAYKCLAVEGHKSGVVSVYDYCRYYIAPFPLRKYKTKSLKKIIREEKKKKKENKKDDMKELTLEEKNLDKNLIFRLTNIYNEKELQPSQENTYEKSINIY